MRRIVSWDIPWSLTHAEATLHFQALVTLGQATQQEDIMHWQLWVVAVFV